MSEHITVKLSADTDEIKALLQDAANRITALENACRAYLVAYDGARGTVYVEPIIRAAMEDSSD